MDTLGEPPDLMTYFMTRQGGVTTQAGRVGADFPLLLDVDEGCGCGWGCPRCLPCSRGPALASVLGHAVRGPVTEVRCMGAATVVM